MSTLPPNWPASSLRKYVIGTGFAGSTELVDAGDAAYAMAATHATAGDRLKRHRQEVSARKRSAIRQAIGLEPVKAAPRQPMQPISLTNPRLHEKVLERLNEHPEHFGITREEIPKVRLVRLVWAQEKKLAAQAGGARG